MQPTLVLAAALLTASACLPPTGDTGDDAPPADPDPDPHPLPPPPPPPLTCSGTYALRSVLDLQAAAVLPQPLYDTVDTLRGLRDEPGRTLFELAEAAGVPYVDTLRDALPDAVESRLYGWIDAHLAGVTYGGGPVADAIDQVVTAAETVLADIRLDSELDLAAPSSTHHLRAVAFAMAGGEVRFDLAAAEELPLALSVAVATQIDASPAQAQLALGDHAFGFAYGELAYAAIETAVQARYGTDVRGLLAAAIDCPTLATAIAGRCVLGQCVGHATELRAICDAGVDYIADELRAHFAEARFDAVALHAGSATLVDGDTADGRADVIDGGVWTAEIDAGLGPRAAPGTFTGARR